jgi:hypothetical protein
MFALIAAIVFATALSLAVGTMTHMFITYQDRMMAALLYQPDQAPRAYHVVALRSRKTQPAAIGTVCTAKEAMHPMSLAA